MNKLQTNYFRMFLSIQEYLDENSTIWVSIPRIANYKNNLAEIILSLTEKSEEARKGISVTDRKDKIKELIGRKLSVLSGMLVAFAHDTDNIDLVNKVKATKSDIKTMKEVEIDSFVKSITSIATDYMAELADFGTSEATVTEINGLAEEFNMLIGKPRNILNRKFVALSQVEQLIDEGNKLLRNQLDNLMLMFRDTKPVFYEGYQRARTIIDR